MGETAKGERVLRKCLTDNLSQLSRNPSNPAKLYEVAALYSSLGQKNEAMQYLHKSTAAGWLDFRSMKIDPRFDQLIDNTDFRNLSDEIAAKVTRMREKTTRQNSTNQKETYNVH